MSDSETHFKDLIDELVSCSVCRDLDGRGRAQKRVLDAYAAANERAERLETHNSESEDIIAGLRSENEAREREMVRRGEMVDALLNHCPIDECDDCGMIVCPHKDPLHFHHDGCPSCFFAERDTQKATT